LLLRFGRAISLRLALTCNSGKINHVHIFLACTVAPLGFIAQLEWKHPKGANLRQKRRLVFCNLQSKQVIAGSRACKLNSFNIIHQSGVWPWPKVVKIPLKFPDSDPDPDYHQNLVSYSVAHVSPVHLFFLWKSVE